MTLPFTGFVHFITAIMIYACYLKLNKTYKNMPVKDETLKNLLYFVLYMDIFQILMAIGHLPVLFDRMDLFYYTFNFGYIVGHVFLYIAQAYIVLVPMYLYFSRTKFQKFGPIYFKFLLVFGSIITIINIINPTNPSIDENTGLTIFNVPSIVAGLIPIIVLISFGFTGILFLVKSVNLQDKARAKALFLGISMIVIIVGGPLHETATSVFQYFMADLLIVVAFLFLMAGIYYEQISAKMQKA